MSSCLRIAAEATDPTDLFYPPVAQLIALQDFAVAGTCVYVPPGLNGPGSEKPAIESTFA